MANIEVKTEEWLSADDLQKDPEFPSGTAFKIRKALALLENDPEFRGNIQTMKANGQICKCLHVSKKQAFAERAGFKTYPKKTEEWMSAEDLRADPEFPSGTLTKINEALTRLENDTEFTGYIQTMKSYSQVCKCLHISKKRAFAKRSGFNICPKKTDEWLSAPDLRKDPNFPSAEENKMNEALTRLENDPEFKGYIQTMKSYGRVFKCLHISKKLAFAKRAGFKVYYKKTDEWLSTDDLRKDPAFPSKTTILKALVKLENDPEFKGYIQNVKSYSNVGKCLHISKKQAFADRAGFIAFPKKTEEWKSAEDLRKDPDFPSGRYENIVQALKEFEHDPEFEGNIKNVKSGSRVAKCIHKSKIHAFANRIKQKTFQTGAKTLKSANDIHDIKNQIVPDDQNGM